MILDQSCLNIALLYNHPDSARHWAGWRSQKRWCNGTIAQAASCPIPIMTNSDSLIVRQCESGQLICMWR